MTTYESMMEEVMLVVNQLNNSLITVTEAVCKIFALSNGTVDIQSISDSKIVLCYECFSDLSIEAELPPVKTIVVERQ